MSINTQPVIVWFRQDLRLNDNPALRAACDTGRPVLPLYILDDDNAGAWKRGDAGRWWLHHSLAALNKSMGGHLCLKRGDSKDILDSFIKEYGAESVYWNRCYEPWRMKCDEAIKVALKKDGLDIKSFKASLLFEPWDVLKDDGTPYRVFTPFYKKACFEKHEEPPFPDDKPDNITFFRAAGDALDDWGLVPAIPWYKTMEEEWVPGEEGAARRFDEFLDRGLSHYKQGRDYPALRNVSRLSPHLHFGEISSYTLWHGVKQRMIADGVENEGIHFLRELCWREFSYNLLYHFQDLPEENLQKKFDAFPWQEDTYALKCWQKGMTGYPIVDAGMRELWQTGYMHNRVRMIVGSFLVKNLLLHWHHGERWFWDTLVDADLANNSASWQWIAGCGADAAPYFRIFNPVTQGQKFDPDGTYVRQYVPELSAVPDKVLHCPWEAAPEVLDKAGVKLGETYPAPIVDLKKSRERALQAFATIKAQ